MHNFLSITEVKTSQKGGKFRVVYLLTLNKFREPEVAKKYVSEDFSVIGINALDRVIVECDLFGNLLSLKKEF